MTSLAQVGTAAPAELPEANGPVCTLVQPSELTLAEMSDVQIRAIVGELLQANRELKVLNSKLSDAKNKLIQSEKLASIGQLAAGVAHEINNPIGFIFSNFGTLEQYLQDLFQMLSAYEEAEASMQDAEALARIRQLREDLEIEYLREDIPNLMRESRDGIQRVRKIVQDLKDFSRVDARQEWESVNLHHGIDSTLNIVNNEIKYKADVVKQYGDLPEVQCLPSELNQVFMNLLVNAAHAITKERGTITIRTGAEAGEAWVEVADDGAGIAAENLQRIFDPFFTTKPVGQGTGLGLSLSYGIVQKHGGRMEVTSEIGQGTTFRVTIPVERAQAANAPA
ncbi:ATP-binding protein [Acidovorax sp. RAC01]|uniref:ATP-binding protein n=1 Tax=Acidovorax sp. RAC01 TaxID=1842533 RepID=UPI000856946A|nr:ATP-binding protein [Acidovorax sp. RAC01]AOG22402.1 his Kinase A domain protein [Acidovorax sp. RAC01]